MPEGTYWGLRALLAAGALAALAWVFIERSKAVERYRRSPTPDAPPSRARLIAATTIGLALGAIVFLAVPLDREALLIVEATVVLLLVMAALHYRRMSR